MICAVKSQLSRERIDVTGPEARMVGPLGWGVHPEDDRLGGGGGLRYVTGFSRARATCGFHHHTCGKLLPSSEKV